MNELIIIVSGIAIILIIVLILLKKLDNKVKNILTGIKKFEEKADEERKTKEDELFVRAKEIAAEQGFCSASFLQETLRVGYARAARLVDMLEDAGLIQPANDNNPRKYIGSE